MYWDPPCPQFRPRDSWSRTKVRIEFVKDERTGTNTNDLERPEVNVIDISPFYYHGSNQKTVPYLPHNV